MLYQQQKYKNFGSYNLLKEELNKMGSYSDFLWKFAKYWNPKVNDSVVEEVEEAGDTETTPTAIGNFVLPKRNGSPYFHREYPNK